MPTLMRTWRKRGFLPEEVVFLRRVSPRGADAGYMLALRRQRSSLNANRVLHHWSPVEYRRRIVANYEYRTGIMQGRYESTSHYIDRVFWDYFYWWKNLHRGDPTWDTPKAKRRIRVAGEPRQEGTRRRMLARQIGDLNDKIGKASLQGNQPLRRELERQRNELERSYDMLGD